MSLFSDSNKTQLEAEVDSLSDALSEIQEDVYNNFIITKQEELLEEKSKSNIEKAMEKDLSIFGFSFKKMSNSVKYSIGITFIVLCLLFIIYLLRSLKGEKQSAKPKADKGKKNKKK